MVNIEKNDSANSIIKADIKNQELEVKKEKVAKKIAKDASIPGFRKGKLKSKALERKVKAVKKLYAGDIEKEAVSEAVKDVLEEGIKKLGVETIGEPNVSKFDKNENGIEVEIKVNTKPEINISEEYKECVPEVKLPEVSEEDIQKELQNIAKADASTKVATDKDTVQKGDIAVIDFKGFIDNKPMKNGSAENYSLELGSNSFIPGFEDQITGMKTGETKKIKVTFPENYNAKEIAGKDAEFEVTLQEIQEKVPASIDDDLAKKYLNDANADVDKLKESVKSNIQNQKKAKIFAPKKEEILECLVEKYEIDVPEGIVEKEIDVMIGNEASKLTPAKIKEFQENPEKLKEFREQFREEAKSRVKLTFIINEIATKENVTVSDNELSQVIYYEALMQGQKPQDVAKYYQENNLLPVLKMNLVEEKLLNKLLDEKASK